METDHSCNLICRCNCNICVIGTTAKECLCCTEVKKVRVVVKQYHSRTGQTDWCVTDHPGFKSVCLDVWVLHTAYQQYRMDYSADLSMFPKEDNKKYSYTTYRQFTRWIWGCLGRKIRVILPSCAVHFKLSRLEASYVGFRNPPL